jgi:branched-chain amino acid transport system permease protein
MDFSSFVGAATTGTSWIIVVAFLVMGGLLLLVHKTKLGRAMNARDR